MRNSVNTSGNYLSKLDFVLKVYTEKKPDNGEDSFMYSINRSCGTIGVFDGCGGSGAKKYQSFRGKTGAFIASRAVSAATKAWFDKMQKDPSKANSTLELKKVISHTLSICKGIGGSGSTFKSSLSKDFPTTAAIISTTAKDNYIYADCLWVGDSRCYMLDSQGLKQLSQDDLNVHDAMENLRCDGVITNVISASKDFDIHEKTLAITPPCILFVATDGCFGYFSTPMEFEALLLQTLLTSSNAIEWEQRLSKQLQTISGDDCSLCAVVFGYGDFDKLKRVFSQTYDRLNNRFISLLCNATFEEKVELWQVYKTEYYKYLAED